MNCDKNLTLGSKWWFYLNSNDNKNSAIAGVTLKAH